MANQTTTALDLLIAECRGGEATLMRAARQAADPATRSHYLETAALRGRLAIDLALFKEVDAGSAAAAHGNARHTDVA
jgi:hypothetical protein